MKYIITEEQDVRLSILRRLSSVDDWTNYYLTTEPYYFNICNYDFEDFLSMVIQWVCEKMYYDYYNDVDDDSEEWSLIHNIIVKYIELVHSNTINDFYKNKCGKK